MTPRKVMPLTLANRVGNGAPAMEDLIAVQTAILQSNASVLGAVNEFRKGIDQRLTRQFGDVAEDLAIVKGQLEKIGCRVSDIEQERHDESLLAAQTAMGLAKQHTADVKTADNDRSDAQSRVLSHNQRLAIVVAAFTAAVGAILGVLNFVAERLAH